MNREESRDPDADDQEDVFEWPSKSKDEALRKVLQSRRRIEDLKELRRLREELGDDEFIFDLN